MFTTRALTNDQEWRLCRLAQQTIEKNQSDEFSLDNHEKPFSRWGVMAVIAYFSELDDKYIQQLRRNQIDKGYTLFLPQKELTPDLALPDNILQGMQVFLIKKFEKDNNYTFCCQRLHFFIHQSNHSAAINLLCELILLLDKAKLAQLTLYMWMLSADDLAKLSKTLEAVAHTIICFEGPIPIEQSILLESINDAKLQLKVPRHQANNNEKKTKHDVSKQPSVVTLAKIKALLDKEILLQPIQGKIGFQHQHQYQQQTEQKTEVTILQSWQIQEAKEIKQENTQGRHFLYGDEANHLISWLDIEAAIDPKHLNHEASRLKLSEEILNYHYKGRDIVDLWRRLTGDIKFTQQNVTLESMDDMGRYLAHFSRYVPKRISHKTLLTIVRHPHLFQDGIHLDAIPDSIYYSEIGGALFTGNGDNFSLRPKKETDKTNPFAPRLQPVPKASLPSSEHFNLLTKSGIPSQLFYLQLTKYLSLHDAWHCWRHGFAALNVFNQAGLHALGRLLDQCMEKAGQHKKECLHYFVQALSYYHDLKITKQQAILSSSQVQFEYQQQNDYKQGTLDRLSAALIERVPKEIREHIHAVLPDTWKLKKHTQHDESSDQACQALLHALLAYHQTKLAENIIEQDRLSQWLPLLSHDTHFKLIELLASQDSNAAYNIFVMLQDIYQVWDDIGLADFERSFLSPSMNMASLAGSPQQEALRYLLQLSDVEYHWWQQLTLQHTEQSGFADFADLMGAFQQFLTELESLHIKDALAMPCPLQGINNLQVGLNRVVSVLKRAKKPAEQMHNLANLDWSACGVIYASHVGKYQFINADMQLNLVFESALNDVILQHNGYYCQFHHYRAAPFHLNKFFTLSEWQDNEAKQKLFQFTLGAFFRYIGSEKYTAPMLVYQQLLDEMALPEKYVVINEVTCISYHNEKLVKKIRPRPEHYPVVLSALLPVAAYATTGERALDRLPRTQEERRLQLKDFIHALCEASREKKGEPELDQFHEEHNAIAYEKLVDILDGCAKLYMPRHSAIFDKTVHYIYLDLSELTSILKFLKLAEDNHYKRLRNEKLRKQLADFLPAYKEDEKDEWCTRSVGANVNNQLMYTSTLLEKYTHYFHDALTRLHRHNQAADYAYFIMACLTIKNHTFSFENKGRLLKIIALLPLQIENLTSDAPLLLDFLKQLYAYQDKTGEKALDTVLNVLSCLVPHSCTFLTLTQLKLFVARCESELEHTTIEALVQSHFYDHHIDRDLDEAIEAAFYQSPAALDQAFPGLGSFYASIKTLVLKKYRVSSDDSQLQTWAHFLTLIHQLKNHEQQHQVLQTVLQASHQDIDLSTLNGWLGVLLTQEGVRFHPDYFNALSHGLLIHPQKQVFINEVASWLKYHTTSSIHSQCGYIHLLNKIADIEGAFACLRLGNCWRVASSVAHFHQAGDAWHENFITLITAWQHQGLPVEALTEVFAVLKKFLDIALDTKQYSFYKEHVLLPWLANNEKTLALTLIFAKSADEKEMQHAFNQMLVLAKATTLDLIWAQQSLTKLSHEALAQLAACYQVRPFPAISLLKALLSADLTLEAFIVQHTRDPHHERDKAKLEKQFDTEILWPYLDKVNSLQPHQSSTLGDGRQLYAAFRLVNHIGDKQCRQMSLTEIRQQLHACREWWAEAKYNKEKLTVSLTAFALVREAVYKTSEAPAILWPSAVQTLAILSALNHGLSEGPTPLFMQMATGEGKSLLAVFLAILTWLKGSPVAIVTHRASIALRDAKAYARLFESLDIESRQLTADGYRSDFFFAQLLAKWRGKDEQKPAFSGIYYVEFNDLALIRQQRFLKIGKDIDKMSFIIDEADEIILHNQTDCNLTQTTHTEEEHPHAFVFEHLAAFLKPYSTNQDVLVRLSSLVEFLCKAFPLGTRTCQQIDFLVALSDYLEGAWHARTLQDNLDFVTKKTYAAVLQGDKPMPCNVTFNGVVQQALHGLLNHEAKMQQLPCQFRIAPPTTLFSTMSPEATLSWMQEKGEIIALSATIGSASELMEMQLNRGFSYIKLPKMQNSLRIDYPPQFCANQQQQMEAIAGICLHYIGERTQLKSCAILIIVENIEYAEKLNQHLQKFNPYMLHAGKDDISDELIGKLEHFSGQSNHVLIAVKGLIRRGFDAKLSSAAKLIGIGTYLENEVDEIQGKGRIARRNQATGSRDAGKYFAIYDLERERGRYPGLELKIDKIHINPEVFKKQVYFGHYQKESALRLHRQLTSVPKDIIQAHFFKLWQALFGQEHILKEMRDKVMACYRGALDKISRRVLVKERDQYNQNLLMIYKEALINMQTILGRSLSEKPDDTILSLSKKIESEQQQLISNRDKTLARGTDKPRVRIYPKWNKYVQYNAYLDFGKQSNLNYLTGVVKTLLLSNEDKEALKQEKNAFAQKIADKKKKKSDFLSQLTKMMDSVTGHEALFNQLLSLYERKFDLPHEMNTLKQTIPSDSFNQVVAVGHHITLISRHAALFKKLQAAIDQVYETYQLVPRLNFRFNLLNQQGAAFYQIDIDFSGHAYDAIDREQLLSKIKHYVDVDVQPALPSIQAMQSVLKELRSKTITSMNKIPHDLAKIFSCLDHSLSKQAYHDTVFAPALALLKQYDSLLGAEIKNCVSALSNYSSPLSYQNQTGEPCTALAPHFENLTHLLENEKKRNALAVIHQYIKLFAKNPLSHCLLFRQQTECLTQLSLFIVNSMASDSLQSINDKWRKMPLHYQQQCLSCGDLMHLRKEKSGLFGVSQSPDVSIVCQEIEGIIAKSRIAMKAASS